MEYSVKDIIDTINCNSRFLITTHVRADGDALGSEVALYHVLNNMGKSVTIANHSAVPQIFKFFMPSDGLHIYPDIPHEDAEVVFFLDAPTFNRAGKVGEIIPKDAVLINIDHHISNEYFGKINWVDVNMCATGELLLSLFKEMKVDITPEIATALYVAILTDTGKFLHSNTTPGVLRAAAFLIECGARHTEIAKNVYNSNPFNVLQLYSYALGSIKLHLGSRVATVILTKHMLEETNVNPVDLQEFADIPVSIDGVSVGILLREMSEPHWVKVSLRSRDDFNVDTIARKFGGGGHKYAAGCEIQGNLEEVQELLMGAIKDDFMVKK